jgi:hypothetical protein
MAKITFNSYKKAIQDHYEFVKNKDISTVNSKILETAKDHPYFKSHVISKEDGRHSFIFHLPGDSNREVYLEIMTFHFNANQ